MSGQRARSAVDADHRSALPRVPGIPWWGAVLLAATAAAVGFAFDAGTGAKELSAVFAVCYVTGCLLAVLAVRQSGIFTAVIQPPLILFFAVPGAYFLFHGSTIGGIKDILINCGYPLIERFPLMFITSAVVLVAGMMRWYLGVVGRRAVPVDLESDAGEDRTATKGAAAETTVLDAVEATPRRRRREHSIDRPTRATAAAAAAGAAADEPPRRPRKTPKAAPVAGASRSRHVRPPEPEPEFGEPTTSRPRRRPAAQAGPPVDPPVEPRRRPRPPQPREAREPRRNLPPIDGRGAHERPERLDRPLRSERPDRSERPERRRRPSGYDPYDPYEPRPSEPRTTNGASGSHHPVSRVRYRGDDDGESRTEHRARPTRPRGPEADSWEFDA